MVMDPIEHETQVRVSTAVKAAYIPAPKVIVVYVYLFACTGTNNAKSGKGKGNTKKIQNHFINLKIRKKSNTFTRIRYKESSLLS